MREPLRGRWMATAMAEERGWRRHGGCVDGDGRNSEQTASTPEPVAPGARWASTRATVGAVGRAFHPREIGVRGTYPDRDLSRSYAEDTAEAGYRTAVDQPFDSDLAKTFASSGACTHDLDMTC